MLLEERGKSARVWAGVGVGVGGRVRGRVWGVRAAGVGVGGRRRGGVRFRDWDDGMMWCYLGCFPFGLSER